MIVYDHLWAPYGYVIKDKKLRRLLLCFAVRRLKNIGQNGAANYVPDPRTKKVSTTTRYEHSVGCMLLTLLLGGTIKEAIVALLHDIMHTAFSHTVDFLAKDPSVSYHEKFKDKQLRKFKLELVLILGKRWKFFFDESKHVLIKKNNPFAIDICDYIARDAVSNGFVTAREVRHQMKYMAIDPATRRLCCTTKKARKWWIATTKTVNDSIYNSPWNVYVNHRLAEEIRDLITEKHVTFDEILDPKPDTETKIVDKISVKNGKSFKNGILDSTRDKNLVLEKKRSCAKHSVIVGTFPVRKRYVLPPLLGGKMDELCSLVTTVRDLVIY